MLNLDALGALHGLSRSIVVFDMPPITLAPDERILLDAKSVKNVLEQRLGMSYIDYEAIWQDIEANLSSMQTHWDGDFRIAQDDDANRYVIVSGLPADDASPDIISTWSNKVLKGVRAMNCGTFNSLNDVTDLTQLVDNEEDQYTLRDMLYELNSCDHCTDNLSMFNAEAMTAVMRDALNFTYRWGLAL